MSGRRKLSMAGYIRRAVDDERTVLRLEGCAYRRQTITEDLVRAAIARNRAT